MHRGRERRRGRGRFQISEFGLVNARCRDRYCRRRKNINLLERCAELLGNNPSDPLCQKVIRRKKHHPRIELLANVAGHVVGVDAHHLTVIR